MRVLLRHLSRATVVIGAFLVCCQLSFAQLPAASSNCNQATPEPVVDVALPGHPFFALATADGCWIFVSMQKGNPPLQSGVAVVQRTGGKATLARVVPLDNSVGMVFSHDGKMLMVTNDD